MELLPLSTGHRKLDTLLGGGFHRNRMVEVYGDTNAYKEFLALEAAGLAPLPALFFDIDSSFPHHVIHDKKITNKIFIIEGVRFAKDYLDILRNFEPSTLSFVVFSPITFLPVHTIIDLIPWLKIEIKRLHASALFLNHCNVLQEAQGYSVIPKYSSQRIEMRLKEVMYNSDHIATGVRVACKRTKSHLLIPQRTCDIEIQFVGDINERRIYV